VDTYTIFKAARETIKWALASQPELAEKGDLWFENEAIFYANAIVEDCIKQGMMYPFSELNKHQETFAYYPTSSPAFYR
jgi:hypothetical protein